MAKYAIPTILNINTSTETLQDFKTFPLCGKIDTSIVSSIQLVACPMVDDKLIELGCCIDSQSTAREEDFKNQVFYEEIFVATSESVNKKVDSLRKICLAHQIAILEGQIQEVKDDNTKNQWYELLRKIIAVHTNLG
jgi:hypothetical protein